MTRIIVSGIAAVALWWLGAFLASGWISWVLLVVSGLYAYTTFDLYTLHRKAGNDSP